jgi:hypothetical protein
LGFSLGFGTAAKVYLREGSRLLPPSKYENKKKIKGRRNEGRRKEERERKRGRKKEERERERDRE